MGWKTYFLKVWQERIFVKLLVCLSYSIKLPWWERHAWRRPTFDFWPQKWQKYAVLRKKLELFPNGGPWGTKTIPQLDRRIKSQYIVIVPSVAKCGHSLNSLWKVRILITPYSRIYPIWGNNIFWTVWQLLIDWWYQNIIQSSLP